MEANSVHGPQSSYGRACANCSRIKSKCIYREGPTQCERLGNPRSLTFIGKAHFHLSFLTILFTPRIPCVPNVQRLIFGDIADANVLISIANPLYPSADEGSRNTVARNQLAKKRRSTRRYSSYIRERLPSNRAQIQCHRYRRMHSQIPTAY